MQRDTWWVLVAGDGLESHPHEQPARVTVAIAPAVRGGASPARPPPEVTGEAVQDAVRVLRDPVDAGAPLQRRRGSRGLRGWRWVDDVHRRRAEEHKEEAAICRESERWG